MDQSCPMTWQICFLSLHLHSQKIDTLMKMLLPLITLCLMKQKLKIALKLKKKVNYLFL